MPVEIAEAQSAVINNTVYIGGKANATGEYIVYCYNHSTDKWSSLPPLPIRYFGLGQVKRELVAVGGMKKGEDVPTNQVYVYDAALQRWKQTMSPMPTCRAFPSTVSFESKSVLIAAGGLVDLYDDEYTPIVEMYRTGTASWCKVKSLPIPLHYISMVGHGSTCYILGESVGSGDKQRGFYCSIDDLTASTADTMEAVGEHNVSEERTYWKPFLGAPSYQPAVGVLGGHVLAIGGWTSQEAKARKKEVYVYSPSMNSWVYIDDLPAPRVSSTIAVLSLSEILLVGGYGGDDNKVNTVYIATLNLKV